MMASFPITYVVAMLKHRSRKIVVKLIVLLKYRSDRFQKRADAFKMVVGRVGRP